MQMQETLQPIRAAGNAAGNDYVIQATIMQMQETLQPIRVAGNAAGNDYPNAGNAPAYHC